MVAAGLQALAALAEEQPAIPDRPRSRELEQPGYLPEEQPQEFELPAVELVKPSPRVPAQDLDVKGYAFEGNRVFAPNVLQEIAAPHAGRKVSPAELEELWQKLSR